LTGLGIKLDAWALAGVGYFWRFSPKISYIWLEIY